MSVLVKIGENYKITANPQIYCNQAFVGQDYHSPVKKLRMLINQASTKSVLKKAY